MSDERKALEDVLDKILQEADNGQNMTSAAQLVEQVESIFDALLAERDELRAYNDDLRRADSKAAAFAFACVREDGITPIGAMERQRGRIADLLAERDALRAELSAEQKRRYDGNEISAREHAEEVSALIAERDALRDALLAPPRVITVWCGAMPESNGKHNYTAILHTGDITEGFCLSRSEYPGRVSYDADMVRYLIGEIKERPNCLDYDGDKHSGHKEQPRVITDAAELVDGRWYYVRRRTPEGYGPTSIELWNGNCFASGLMASDQFNAVGEALPVTLPQWPEAK